MDSSNESDYNAGSDLSGEFGGSLPPNQAYSAATGYDLTQDESTASALRQMQQRLFFLASQVDSIQQQISRVLATVDQERDQLDEFLRQMAQRSQSSPPPPNQFIELGEQLSVHHDQLNFLTRKLTDLATQEQMVRLATLMASQQQVVELTEAVRELSRAQQRSNELGDSRNRQVSDLLTTMQNLLNRRSRLEDQQLITTPEQLEGLRAEGRGEFAANFLPAIDGIERVLEEGRVLVARHRQEIVESTQATPANMADPRHPDRQQNSGLVHRLRSRLTGENEPVDPANPSPLPASALPASSAVTDSVTAQALNEWLRTLALVRDRFLAVLASEGIQPIPTLRQPFDPMVHLAVHSETRNDLPANTIVREVRRGFRQGKRVLRYAEVVVTRLV